MDNQDTTNTDIITTFTHDTPQGIITMSFNGDTTIYEIACRMREFLLAQGFSEDQVEEVIHPDVYDMAIIGSGYFDGDEPLDDYQGDETVGTLAEYENTNGDDTYAEQAQPAAPVTLAQCGCFLCEDLRQAGY
jgi:hypothetical protein